MTNLHYLELSIWHKLHSLSHAQIGQDLFSTTEDGVELVRSVEHLYGFTHAGLSETPSTENVDSFISDFVAAAGSVSFEESDGPAEEFVLVFVGELAHLVRDGFEPGLVGFADGNHFTQPMLVSGDLYMFVDENSLLSDNGLIYETLAKDNTLVGPFQTFLCDGTAFSDVTTSHSETFVVEIAHDDDETVVFLA
jgi:hypothetical protein